MNDILDILDSDQKPFEQHEPKENKPQSNNYNKPKRENLWEKTDFQPRTIDPAKLHKSGKSYMWYNYNPTTEIPDDVKTKIISIATSLSSKGYTFRHNGDDKDVIQNKIISIDNIKFESFLPWKKFNQNISEPKQAYATLQGYELANTLHKKFLQLPPAIRAILANTMNTLLGSDVTDPVDFILAYTEDGLETYTTKGLDFTKCGNLNFILKAAAQANIPAFNLKNTNALENLKEFLQ